MGIIGNMLTAVGLKKKVPIPRHSFKRIERKEFIVPDVEVFQNKARYNLLLVDDHRDMISSYFDDFTVMNREYGFDVNEHFNIYIATTPLAGFSTMKLLEKEKTQFDVAMLDITLQGISPIDHVEIDGVDLAIEIKNHCRNCDVTYVTGHSLTNKTNELFGFMKKHKDYFNTDIRKQTMFKSDDRPAYFKEVFDRVIAADGLCRQPN